jgi:hypothetical protein
VGIVVLMLVRLGSADRTPQFSAPRPRDLAKELIHPGS